MLKPKAITILFVSFALSSCITGTANNSKDSQSVTFFSFNPLLDSTHDVRSQLLLGHFLELKYSSYEPSSDCKETADDFCIQWSTYYLYSITPDHPTSKSQPLMVIMSSHTPLLGPSKKPYLLELRKLSNEDAKATEAEYLIVQRAEIDSDYFCMESSIKSVDWLYSPSSQPIESRNEYDEYCYSF